MIQNLIVPLFLSFGGSYQKLTWVRVRGGYYPQSHLFPVDVLVYAVVLFGLAGIAYWTLKRRAYRWFWTVCVCAWALPFGWAAATFAAGFDQRNCHIPAHLLATRHCYDPHGPIYSILILQGIAILVIGVCWYAWKRR